MPNYNIVNPCFLYGEIHKTGSIDAQAEDAQPLVDSGSLVLADDDQINFNSTAEADRIAKEAADKAATKKASKAK